jgi:anti-anti-sigma regulatory factor
MQITERSVGDVIILDLDGRLVVEDGVTPFVERMNALVRHGRKKILLNFALVTYLDSSGVGAVV